MSPQTQDTDTNGAPPEVETELVGEAHTGDLNAPENRASAEPVKPSVNRFVPVAIGVFVIGAAVIGGVVVWRLQPPKVESNPVVAAEEAGAAQPLATPMPAEPAFAPATPQNADRPPANADKIANSAVETKRAMQDFDFGDSIDQGPGLPPPPQSIDNGNAALQQAAKEAQAALFADERPADPTEPSFVVESPSVVEEQSLADRPETTPAPVQPQFNSSPVDAPDAELEEMALRLEEERRISEAQADEIAALKASIESIVAAGGAGLVAEPASAIAPDRAIADPVKFSLALLSLSRAVDSGRPYQVEFDRVARVVPQSTPGLETLRTHAAAGAPSLTALQKSFAQHARDALSAYQRETARGPAGAAMARLSGLVSIRPADPQAGASPASVISRAEAMIARDDVGGAVAELKGLQGAAAASFAPWVEGANARLETQRAVAFLGDSLLESSQP